MNKKILISALAAVLSLPAMAEIANNATCNNTNLGQSDNNSTANVEANWNANTININWYNGNTKITSNTCTYDGSITLPAQPTKPGYTFAGWRLRGAVTQKQCNEIDNQSECDAQQGCAFAFPLGENFGECVSITGTRCADISNESDCESFTPWDVVWSDGVNKGTCRWRDNKCVYFYTSGGSND